MKRKLNTALYAASVATLATSALYPAVAQSRQYGQQTSPIADLIGMIANASAKSNAKKKWAKVSPEIQQCVNTFSESKNINVDQIIAAGISPTHEKILPIVTMCQTVMSAQLKSDFPCTVTNAKGQQVPTTCVQSYVKAVRGAWVPVSRDDFLRAGSNNETVNVADFETTVAQNSRLADEKRLAQEAAAKAEALRAERLAREQEERRRFAASPEGKRQAAEQAARERKAEMTRQVEARAAAMPLSPALARSMLRVWPAKRWSSVWSEFVLELQIQALQPSVKITSITVNKGSCNINLHYALPVNLDYGQTASARISEHPKCNVISAEIGTSKGVANFRF